MSDESPVDAQISRNQSASALTVPAALAREALPVPAAAGGAVSDQQQPVPPTGVSAPGDIQVRLQFAEATHQYIRDFIRLGDQKATFFFAGATALLAFLYRNDVSARWLKPVMQWNIVDVFAFVAMVALAIGAVTALLVVMPRTPGSRRGFLFWEAIAEYETGRQYADDLSTLSPASLFQVKAEHCFDLARVCSRKYKFLRCALWICLVGLAASLAVFLTSEGGQSRGVERTKPQSSVAPDLALPSPAAQEPSRDNPGIITPKK